MSSVINSDILSLIINSEGLGGTGPEVINVSIVLNGFENKAKYGAGYGYGYGYGYGAYANGYHDDDKPTNIFIKYFNFLLNIKKKKKSNKI